MRYYCTYFDHNYLPRGLALHESLRDVGGDFELWILCLSPECHALLTRLALPGMRLLKLSEFEAADPALLQAKSNRSIVEYYFTCTASLVQSVFAREPGADLVTYLDSDLFFFQSPEPIFAEMGNHPVAIIGHRFHPSLKHLEETGIYNVGWVSFRRDPEAFACLAWWRERCLEWCYDRVEPGRYGDQKYLDQWPTLFPQTIVLQHKGANLAPWNLANYRISESAGNVMVDDEPLIFFHFHAFRQLSNHVFDPHIRHFGAKPSRTIVRGIFMPYWHALCRAAAAIGVAQSGAWLSEGIRGTKGEAVRPVASWKRVWKRWRYNFSVFRGVMRRRYYVAWPGGQRSRAQPAANLKRS